MNSSHQGFEGFKALAVVDPLSGADRLAMEHRTPMSGRPEITRPKLGCGAYKCLVPIINQTIWTVPCESFLFEKHPHDLNYMFAALNPSKLGSDTCI